MRYERPDFGFQIRQSRDALVEFLRTDLDLSVTMLRSRPLSRRHDAAEGRDSKAHEVTASRSVASTVGRTMEVDKILEQLRDEREAVEEAIITLERLARGRSKRRGRPPAWLAEVRNRGTSAPAPSKPSD